MPPFEPKIGDLVILKGGIVGRILGLNDTGRYHRPYEGGDQRRGRVLAQTWYPVEGWRLVPFDHILADASPPKSLPRGRRARGRVR